MSSDSSPGRFQKKYLGSVNKNSHTSSPRSSNAKLLTTGSKISAPKPLNLPSLRHESSKASPDSTCSTSGESDNHSTTIVSTLTMINRWGSPLQQHTTSGTSDSDTKSKDSASSSSPISHQHSPSTSPAWSAITSTTKKVTDTTATSTPISAITTIPSPPCDSTPKNTIVSPKKDHVKVTVSHHAKPADIPMPFTQASEPSNMSWDEMVSEEMDFNVSVVDDDDNNIKLEDRESTAASLEDNNDNDNTSLGKSQSLQQQPVSPSDRFTDDYDRSYPSTSKRTSPGSLYNSQPQETYRHQDRYHHHHHHHYHDQYNNNNTTAQGGSKWSSERRGSEHSNTSGYRGQRRPSSSSLNATGGGGWNHHNDHQQRRISQDRPKPPSSPQQHQYHDTTSATTTTTLLRRPSASINNTNNSNGLYSTSDDRPPEIVAAQRQAMLSAAEQAKKRREADEAERQAAAARARQKALALAPPPPPAPTKPVETTPPPSPENHTSRSATSTPAITILTNTHKDQPKASNKTQAQPPKSTDDTKDTERVQKTASTPTPVVKKGTLITSTTASTGTHHLFANKPRAPLTEDEQSWENYVNQIKKPATTSDKDGGEDKTTTVSDWSSFAQRLQRSTEEKKTRITKDTSTNEDSLADEQRQVPAPELKQENLDETTPANGQDTTKPKSTTQIPPPESSVAVEEGTTGAVKSDSIKPRRFMKPNGKLDKNVYPIFPDAIGRLVLPKPTSLQFMIDPDESDDELMHTLEHHYSRRVDASPAKPALDLAPELPTPSIKYETTTDRVESSPQLDDHAPIPQQHLTTTTTMEDEKQSTWTLDDQAAPDSKDITTKKKEQSTPTSTPYDDDDAIYPQGLPIPGSPFGTVSPASITPKSIHATLSNLDLPSGYNKDTLPPPHNEHYPILMYPLQVPPTDLLTISSDQSNQSGFSVVLLPPGNAHPSAKHGSSYRRKGNGRSRGARNKHRQHPASSGTGSWRVTDSTNADRPTANPA